MTREELIYELNNRIGFETDNERYAMSEYEKEFYRSILNLLEQEPSEDCISREAVIEEFEQYGENRNSKMYVDTIMDILADLPSATPQPKTGHWIDIDAETYTWKIRCDKCGHERGMMSTQGHYPKFCEECGADMRESEGTE